MMARLQGSLDCALSRYKWLKFTTRLLFMWVLSFSKQIPFIICFCTWFLSCLDRLLWQPSEMVLLKGLCCSHNKETWPGDLLLGFDDICSFVIWSFPVFDRSWCKKKTGGRHILANSKRRNGKEVQTFLFWIVNLKVFRLEEFQSNSSPYQV